MWGAMADGWKLVKSAVSIGGVVVVVVVVK